MLCRLVTQGCMGDDALVPYNKYKRMTQNTRQSWFYEKSVSLIHTAILKLQNISCKISATKYQQQNISYKRAATKYQQQNISYKISATKYQQQNISHKKSATKYQLQNSSYKISAAKYQLQNISYKISATKYQLQNISCKISATKIPLQCLEGCFTSIVFFRNIFCLSVVFFLSVLNKERVLEIFKWTNGTEAAIIRF